MIIILEEPLKEENKRINVNSGDRVQIGVWDLGQVEGTVTTLTDDTITVHNAEFLSGAYPRHMFDYSELEAKTEFSFSLCNVCEISAANL